ncbi:MAG: hypothetical protein HN736_12630 [Anaerolineae bacterium]|nr:hypothetical protein [Anaerolineae bacterium]MBT3713281.1 hypothetical protein [Anaerolineae bacterium]MBT4310543.1 hypothetical protein [Anaerolineae bacterium]MBT4457412.1 hypothetical protein [Anaerolineae bacterium]MBT4841740.1 hypothetical protein [Anaerolineae bacterium]
MKELIVLPILSLMLVIQMAVVSRIPLFGLGYADLVLVTLAAWSLQERVETSWHWAVIAGLLVGWASALPWIVPVIGYLLMVAFARLLVRRIWQAPLLAMFVIVFFGSLIFHLLSALTLQLLGSPILIGDALSVVTLPSLMLNLFLALPLYAIFRDLSVWVYDIEDYE